MDIILATGGSGGHIFPAVTLAKSLKRKGYNCILFTNKKTINAKSYILPLCSPSDNKFKFLILFMYSIFLALYQISKLKPKLVIGFGSYASFPTLLAAKILSIPIILHEQNTILGRTNRFFFKSAKLIATSFPDTKYAEGSKCILTGNFVNVTAKRYSSTEPVLNVLIVAGSQGANFFDGVVSSVICNLPVKIKEKINFMQQCRETNLKKVENLYKLENVNFELSEFFNDMKSRLAMAHLVISRAGATSIAEITLARRAAIYIPYARSKDNHQFFNAKYIEGLRAAKVVEENEETEKNLKELLVYLLCNPGKLQDLINNTKKTGIKNGVANFVRLIDHEFN